MPQDDRLTEYADLLAWSRRTGLLDEAGTLSLWRVSQQRPAEAKAFCSRAQRLRNAIYGVGWSLAHGIPPCGADVRTLAKEARIARGHQSLEVAGHTLEWRITAQTALDGPLWRVALSAENYFTSGDLTRLHSCPSKECGWLFEDTTRNRSRQWCGLRCGNLDKVRRFRSREARRQRGSRTAAR